MRFKRILTGAYALALILPLIISMAHAHPGRTDGNGGHTDSDTGDYHYHHGFEAHAHFDIDGNGTIDCPFDYVDATNHTTGTSTSGTYTPGDGSEDGYAEGYADGYKKGEKKGQEAGYEDGVDDAKKDYEKTLQRLNDEHDKEVADLKNLYTKISVPLVAAFLICFVCLCRSSRKRQSIEDNFAHRSKMRDSEHSKQISALNAEHDAKIKKLEKDFERQCSNMLFEHNAMVKRLSVAHDAEIRRLKTTHADEINRLTFKNKKMKRFNILDKIASGDDETIQLPPLVRLKLSFTPIKGNSTEQYPYGFFTVFVSPLGTKYHCKRNCAPTAKPMHFFDLPAGALPCSKCVSQDMYPQPLPEWYHQIRKKLEDEYSDADKGKTQSEKEAHYYMENAMVMSNDAVLDLPKTQL